MPQISSPIRARDLRANIQAMGFEKGTAHTLELLLEEFSSMRQNMRALAQMMELCVQQIENMVHVGDELGKQMNELRRTVLKDEA